MKILSVIMHDSYMAADAKVVGDRFAELTTKTVTLTFTATSDTVYWVWNMANVSDGTVATISVDVEKFSATHKNGGYISYL